MIARGGAAPAVLIALLACGCAPAVRPTELTVPAPLGTAALIATTGPIEAAPAPAAKACTKRVRVASIVAATPTCQVNGLAVGDTATLTLPCSGTGDARADFGPDQTFRGTFDTTTVHLRSERIVEFEDGCRWRFKQVITGAPATRTLQLAYDEEIVDGDQCYSPCGARGVLTVE